MEKPAVKSKNKFLKILLLAKSKNKFLKLLPRAVSSITSHNLPFTPGRNKKAVVKAGKLESHPKEEHSGQNLSIIQAKGGRRSNAYTCEAQEPTSTKISCMGHIKHRKKLAKNMNFLLLKDMQNNTLTNSKPGRISDASTSSSTLLDRAPSLSQMKQFASGRGSIDNCDWRMARIESHEKREEEDPGPVFAPILVGDHGGLVGLGPRKETNLWRRRTMGQLEPIEINTDDKDILPHVSVDKSQSPPLTFEFAKVSLYTSTPSKFWYF